MVKAVEKLREMSDEELIKRLDDLRHEYRKLKTVAVGGGPSKNYAQFRNIRREIARILTILRERGVRL